MWDTGVNNERGCQSSRAEFEILRRLSGCKNVVKLQVSVSLSCCSQQICAACWRNKSSEVSPTVTFMHIRVYISIFKFVYLYIHTYLIMYMNKYTYVYIRIYVYINIHFYICLGMYLYVRIWHVALILCVQNLWRGWSTVCGAYNLAVWLQRQTFTRWLFFAQQRILF